MTPPVFSITLSGTQPFCYQWRRNGSPLADVPSDGGGIVSGSHASSLSLAALRPSDAGQYDCVITNSCGSVTSDPATLTVCPSDFNCDGFSDAADLDAFLSAFFAASPDSDINGDGFTDALDYDRFTADFVAGC